MYKWHVHSAIGRSRPVGNDFARVADGIAASLRQFHVSASRNADDGSELARFQRIFISFKDPIEYILTTWTENPSPPSQAERSASAAAEITSLKPAASRGIDARSLAAAPTPRFTIRRMDFGSPVDRGGRGGSFTGSRGRGGGVMRGRGARGGARGSRGGARGRGGRGGAKRPKRKQGARVDEDSIVDNEPMTAEEKAYVDRIEMGVARAFPAGTTTLEELLKDSPAMATSTAPSGIVEGIRDRMRILAGQTGNQAISSRDHALAYNKGNGTFFVDDADLARATSRGRDFYTPKKYDTLDETERRTILQTLVAGQHPPMKQPAPRGDPLTNIDTYTQRNETYLATDTKTLKAKVQTLLPVKRAAAAPAKEIVT